MDESETDDASVIGEEAHIVGRNPGSARFESSLTAEHRDKFDNLLLLCSIHHKLIDDQENTYTVDILHEYKKSHESWVKANLQSDPLKQRDDEVYASYVDEFIKLADVDHWLAWTSYVFGTNRPRILVKHFDNLSRLLNFILSRVWPRRYAHLERAFHNFKAVTNDFMIVYKMHAEILEYEDMEEKEYMSKPSFRKGSYTQAEYEELERKYEFHCWLIEDLLLEMTRAANYLFDMVRLYLFPGFRIKEGVLLIQIGPFEDLSWKTIRTEYSLEEREELYPGLRQFMEIRDSRSYRRDVGVSEDYFFNPFGNRE